MNISDYLLKNVTPQEFVELKGQEADLVASAIEHFNGAWRQRIQRIKVNFKYNPLRSVIGIYVKREEKQRLAVERNELSEEEDAVVASLYQTLEQRLDRMRLLRERWVDTI